MIQSLAKFSASLLVLTIGSTSLGQTKEGSDLTSASLGSLMWTGSHSPVPYRILPRPTSKGPIPASPPHAMVAKPIDPYAYGWFGTKATQHWSRSFGNQRSYTQWTLK